MPSKRDYLSLLRPVGLHGQWFIGNLWRPPRCLMSHRLGIWDAGCSRWAAAHQQQSKWSWNLSWCTSQSRKWGYFKGLGLTLILNLTTWSKCVTCQLWHNRLLILNVIVITPWLRTSLSEVTFAKHKKATYCTCQNVKISADFQALRHSSTAKASIQMANKWTKAHKKQWVTVFLTWMREWQITSVNSLL